MRFGDGAAQLIGQRRINTAILGEMVQCLGLIEAGHLDRPFDWFSGATNGKPAVGGAGDGDDAAIKARGIKPVNLDLGRASRLAVFQRREVEKGKPHRALDLERTLAGQEHRGGMGVYARDGAAAMRGRVGEEIGDRLLWISGHTQLRHGRA